MRATVIEINFNAVHSNGKSYVKFVTQGLPYKGQTKPPRVHMVWPAFNAELVESIKLLAAGDSIEYTVNDTQYKNMVTVTKTAATPAGSETEPNGSGRTYVPKQDVQKSIARAASMKEATQIVLFKAKKTDDILEDILEDIVQVTQYLEKFLLFDKMFDVDNKTEGGTQPSEDDGTQPNDEEIPF